MKSLLRLTISVTLKVNAASCLLALAAIIAAFR